MAMTLFLIAVLGAFLFALAAFAGLILVIFRKTRPAGLWTFLAALSVIPLTVSAMFGFWKLELHKARDTIARARPLTAALERFREANGSYPGSLDELMPKYMEKIPLTADEGRFSYEREDHEYVLWFRFSDYYFYWPTGVKTQLKWEKDAEARGEHPPPFDFHREMDGWGVYMLLD